jgi:hypothetical protein
MMDSLTKGDKKKGITMNVTDLKILRDQIKSIDLRKEKWDMSNWECCAYGHCNVKKFKKKGLIKTLNYFSRGSPEFCSFDGEFLALAMFFEITGDQSENLFYDLNYKHEKGAKSRDEFLRKINKLLNEA